MAATTAQRDRASGQASQSKLPRERLPPARTGQRRARWLTRRHGLDLIGTEGERGIGAGGSPDQALPRWRGLSWVPGTPDSESADLRVRLTPEWNARTGTRQ